MWKGFPFALSDQEGDGDSIQDETASQPVSMIARCSHADGIPDVEAPRQKDIQTHKSSTPSNKAVSRIEAKPSLPADEIIPDVRAPQQTDIRTHTSSDIMGTEVTTLHQISVGRLSITPGWLSPQLVARLQIDAQELHSAGAFSSAALGGRDEEAHSMSKQRRNCDSCGLFDDAVEVEFGVGDPDARDILFECLANLRTQLMEFNGDVDKDKGAGDSPNAGTTPRKRAKRGARWRLSEHMELQYLRYPGAGTGFYRRHIDQQFGRESELGLQPRAISILVYLNQEWDCAQDGGQLRAYYHDRGAGKGGGASKGRGDKGPGRSVAEEEEDVEPKGGTLVLFDSKSVEHEALPTRKERWALVGWFLDDTENNKEHPSRGEGFDGDGGEPMKRRKKKQNRKRRNAAMH